MICNKAMHSKHEIDIEFQKAILKLTKRIIMWLSAQLTSHINSTIINLNSLVETIYCRQLDQFEQVKKKIFDEVISFEERLTSMVLGTQARIAMEMSLIKGRLDEHRKKVRGKLEEYVKKIIIDLANLRYYGFQDVHRDLDKITFMLDRIDLIASRPGYHGSYNLWYKFIKNKGKSVQEMGSFVDLTNKLREFRKEGTRIIPKIKIIRQKIKGIRSSLSKLQTKIPDFGDNDYKEEWRLMDKIKDFKVGPTNLLPVITSLNIQIREATEEFIQIQEKIKPIQKKLQELIKPIESCIDFEIITYIKETIVDERLNLDKVVERIADLGIKIKDGSIRLEKSLSVYGYLSVIDHKLFAFEEPRSVKLDKIEDLMSTIKKNAEFLSNLDGFFFRGFKRLKSRHVPQFVPDEILDELHLFEKDISSKTKKLKEKLEKYIKTLEFIKSIYEQLKKIKQIAQKQDEAINGTVFTFKCSTRIVDSPLRIYRYFRPLRYPL